MAPTFAGRTGARDLLRLARGAAQRYPRLITEGSDMRSRVLAVLVAVVAIQAVGCSRLCRTCGDSRVPPPALNEKPLPPPASPSGAALPAANTKPTGAYGGSGGD